MRLAPAVVFLLFVALALAQSMISPILTAGVPARAQTTEGLHSSMSACTSEDYGQHLAAQFQYTLSSETDVQLYLTSCFDTEPNINEMVVRIDIEVCDDGDCTCLQGGLNPTEFDEMGCDPANTNGVITNIVEEFLGSGSTLVFTTYRADQADSTFSPVSLAIYECPTADFVSATPTECNVVCSRTCLNDISCSTSGRTGCTACAAPRFLDVAPGEEFGRCSYFCPDGQYERTSDQTCQACDEGCLRCDENSCYKCAETNGADAPLYLRGTTCEISCLPGRYANAQFNLCVPCEEECAECNSKEECTKCEDNFFLTGSNKCVRICPEEFFEDTEGGGNVCTACTSPCVDCQGSDANDCITCIEDRWYLQGACVPDCGADHFEGDNGFCVACSDVCEFGCDGPERTDCFASPRSPIEIL